MIYKSEDGLTIDYDNISNLNVLICDTDQCVYVSMKDIFSFVKHVLLENGIKTINLENDVSFIKE